MFYGIKRRMRTKVELTDEEYRLIVKSLISWRNQLIAEGRYTDGIDEVLMRNESMLSSFIMYNGGNPYDFNDRMEARIDPFGFGDGDD